MGRHYVTWVYRAGHIQTGIGLTLLERFKFWLACTRDDKGGNCCCPLCCSYCRDEYLDLKLTPEYAAAKLASLRRFAQNSLVFVRAMLVMGIGLGIAGVFYPSIMNHPDRLVSAALAAVSLFGLWNFSLIQDENNER